jgi:PAP2 superfamily
MTNLLVEWNDLALAAIRTIKPGPPMAARSLGIVYKAIFDAWAAYDNVAKPVKSGVPRRPVAQRTVANREKAIGMAAYRALTHQFPAAEPSFAAKLTAMGMLPSDLSTNVNTPVGVGNVASKDVLDFHDTDNSNQANGYADTSGYAPVNPPLNPLFPSTVDEIPFPGRWQPLTYLTTSKLPATPKFIAPHWGNVKPFALTSGSQFRPSPPQSPLSQGFLDQARHVIEVQAKLTPLQKVIAEYWADGPNSELPPGHWALMTAFVADRDNLGLDDSVKIFFAVASAIADAAIATWEAKRFYDYARPITTIRHLFRGKTIDAWGGPGQGTVQIDGAAWRTFQIATFPTPPFGEYTSGHSAFSMAGATALRRFTGSDRFGYFYAQTNPLAADPTVPVTHLAMRWDTFTQAALDAGESRLYGGIHFYEGNVAGLELGRKVGDAVYDRAQKHWLGTI